jgi:type I restriction enzyme S subunit
MAKKGTELRERAPRYAAAKAEDGVPPGYKRTEVGVIPEEWMVPSLGELFEVTSSKRVFQNEWKTQGVPFYRTRELVILGEKGFVENELFISQDMYNKYKTEYSIPSVGDLLVTGVGTVGKVYVVNGDHDFYFKDGNIIWFKIAGSIEPEYLKQLFNSFLIKKQISDESVGTTVGTYTISQAKKTLISYPSLPEQRAIAEALSDADALVAALDKLIEKKRNIKDAMAQNLLTQQMRLPGFSEQWEVDKLGEIAEIKDGTHQTPKYVVSGIPFYSVENITSNEFSDTKFISEAEHLLLTKSFQIKKSDILMTRIGSIGECKLIDWDVNASFYVSLALLKIHGGYSPDYIYQFSKTEFFKKEIEINSLQSAIPKKINLGQIDNIRINIPSFPEQRAIAAVLSDMDADISALEARRDNAARIKEGMMDALLTGRIRLVDPVAKHEKKATSAAKKRVR